MYRFSHDRLKDTTAWRTLQPLRMCLQLFGRRHRRYRPHPAYFPIFPVYQTLYDEAARGPSMTKLKIHHLLQYTNYVGSGVPCCPILYDLRNPPQQSYLYPIAARGLLARDYGLAPRLLSQHELRQPATSPPVPRLTIICGLFPLRWPIEVRSHHFVTIFDVLHAIYKCVHTPLRQEEWVKLSDRQQRRISQVFYDRTGKAMDPFAERQKGVLRVDCLVLYTMFAGISLKGEDGVSCVLTLNRNVRE
jgi:hypothetical protein